jgi:hypothetical protein
MGRYDALAALWATLTGTTAQKLAAANAMTVAGPSQSVPVLQVMTYLRTNNLWLPIKAAAATSSGAAAALDYNSDPRVQNIDVTLPIVQAMLADLVSHGLLTQAQSDAIVAMSATTIPWWQANGYTSPFTLDDLAAAGGLS